MNDTSKPKLDLSKIKANPTPEPTATPITPAIAPSQDAREDKIAEAKAAAGIVTAPTETISDVIGDPNAIKEFQTYKSSRRAMQMLTETGRKIRFTEFLFITKDRELIAYLDSEIELGSRDITKGEKVSTDERDPMAVLRAKHFKEFQDMQAKEAANRALGITRDMGKTEGAPTLNPTNTLQVPG